METDDEFWRGTPRHAGDSEDGQWEFELIDVNWLAYITYSACRLDWVSLGLGGAFCNGVSAAEVHAALGALQIPTADWPDTTHAVLCIGRAASACINERKPRASD